MLIHSSTTFDIAVASHRARVASATSHRFIETSPRSPWSSASADRHHVLSQPHFQTSRPSRRSLRRTAQ